jgi:hypothetical protein
MILLERTILLDLRRQFGDGGNSIVSDVCCPLSTWLLGVSVILHTVVEIICLIGPESATLKLLEEITLRNYV